MFIITYYYYYSIFTIIIHFIFHINVKHLLTTIGYWLLALMKKMMMGMAACLLLGICVLETYVEGPPKGMVL